MADDVVKISFIGDTSSLKKSLDDVDKTVSNAGSKFADFGKKAAIGLGGVGIGAATAFVHFGQMGIALDTMGKKTQTVFEGSTDDVKAWADQNARSMGLTDDKLENLAAGFGDLLKPMGFTAKQAATMSKDVVGLSGALSAWSGGQKSAAEVSDILAKAMLGERDGLKGLGISISDADVKARLAANGTDKLTGAALEQAEAIATQQLIFEKSADAQKAWSDGSMDGVKAQNEMKAKVDELQETLATKLAPAFAATVDFLLTRVIPAFERLAGWVEDHWPQIHATISDVMTRVREVIETVLGVIQRFWDNWGQQIMTVVEGIWTMISGYIEGAMTYIQGVIDVVMGLIHGDWGRVWDGIQKMVEGVWIAIQGIVEGALEIVRGLADAGMKLVAGVFDQAWEAIKKLAGDALDKLVEFFTKLPGRITGGLGDLGKFIWDAIKAGMDALITKAGQVVSDIVQFFIDLPGRITALGAQFVSAGVSVIDSLWEGLKNVVGKMADVVAIVGEALRTLPSKVIGLATDAGFYIIESVWAGFRNIVNAMAYVGSEVSTFLSGLPGRLWSYGVEVGKAIVNAIADGIRSLPGTIWDALDAVVPKEIGIGPIHIGIPGRASGGPASGLTLVGEQGPELVNFGSGGHVYNNSDTRRMLSGGGGGGGNVININIYNPRVDSAARVDNLSASMSRELAVALRGSVA